MSKNNTSGSKDIMFECGKYRTTIKFSNKTIHIGSFKTKEETVEARQKKAKELLGEFLKKKK